jgi:hypothetical protein
MCGHRSSPPPQIINTTYVMIPTQQGFVPLPEPHASRRRAAAQCRCAQRSFRHEHPILFALIVAMIIIFVLAAFAS